MRDLRGEVRPSRILSRRRAVVASLASLAVVGSAALVGVPSAAADSSAPVRGDSSELQALVSTDVASNHPNAGSSTEHVASLMDNSPGTKWYASGSSPVSASSPLYAIYTLSSPATATSYTITSGGDSGKFPGRDPQDWTIRGSNDPAAATDADDDSWQVLDTEVDQTFAADNVSYVYPVATPGEYRYYQLRITANAGTDNTQIADWTLRSGEQGSTSSIVTPTTQWSYLDDPTGEVDPSPGADRTAWTQVGATLPGSWTDAVGPFGAKNGGTDLGSSFPIATKLPMYRNGSSNPVIPAYFFRTSIELDQAAIDSIRGMYGTLVHDDAVTVYLNGTPVMSHLGAHAPSGNLSYGGDPAVDPRLEHLLFPVDNLRVGENVIAVELHNVNETSSDIYFSLPSLFVTSDKVAAPFTPEEQNGDYSSDTVPADFFTKILSGFDDIKGDPDVVAPNSTGPENDGETTLQAANDRVDVAINHGGAGTEQVKVDKRAQAIDDANHASSTTMTDALGTVLGPIYRSALLSGRLPKTQWLFDHVENSSYENANNSAKGAYGYQRPMNRLGFTTGGACSGGSFTGQTGWIVPNYGSTSGYNGLCTQGSFPSGHTLHGYTAGTTLATVLPELAPQILYRASEYGNNRLVLGFHYPLDVMAGRMIGQASIANRWSDADFRALLVQATDELRDTLGKACADQGYSTDLVQCAEEDPTLEADADALQVYTERLSYSSYTLTDGTRNTDGFPIVFPEQQDVAETVPDGAADLLRTTFPDLTERQRDAVLQATALPGGYALDKTRDGEASWQRINLLAAMMADVSVNDAGNVIVNGENAGGGTVDASDARLGGLALDGVSVSGFDPATTSYDVTLPADTTTAPTLTAEVMSPGAEASIAQATSPSGTASVTVTSEDGMQHRTYTVSLTVAPPPQTPITMTVTGRPKVFGKHSGVVVRATAEGGGAVTGQVRVTEGARKVAAASYTGTKLRVALPKKFSAGKHHLDVTFTPAPGENAVAPAPRSLTLKVTKAKLKKLKVKATKKVRKKGYRPHHQVKVKVKASKKLTSGTVAKGKVKLRVKQHGSFTTVKKKSMKKFRQGGGKLKLKIAKRYVHGKKVKVKAVYKPKKAWRGNVKKKKQKVVLHRR